MKLSVIIPTYNGWDRLPALCTEIIKTLSVSVKKQNFEIVIVDDGSQKRSESYIEDLRNKGVAVKGVFLKKNYGQQLATLAGLCASTGNFVITVDDDLAHSPGDFFNMMDLAEKEGMDVVFAIPEKSSSRMLRKSGSTIRDIIFTVFFQKPTGISVSSFRLIRRSLVDKILGDISEYRYLSVEILKHSIKAGNLQVSFNRGTGGSSYGFIKLLILAFSLIRCSPVIPVKLRRSKTAVDMEYKIL